MTRDDILDAAAQVIRQKGFHGASMADIAEAVKLQKASLYHHVNSKQEILLALLDRALEMLFDLVGQDHLLPDVDFVDRIQNSRPEAVCAGDRGQPAYVFGKAASPVADAGKEEGEADAAVVSDAPADVVDVGCRALAEVGHLVDEADFGREQGVGHVLGHFGAFG